MNPLELWAGAESTNNRVGGELRDQLVETGFAQRLDDLDRLAAMGARRIRFPLLWERTEVAAGRFDWSWADQRMRRLQELGVQPIVGLLHHGSGPLHTNLLDPDFAAKLAGFAEAVARRYPQAQAYTPVNEPLTTARFSGLYGVWYPHRRDDRSFVRALLNQIHATAMAMRAIRRHVPQAQLIQTEDLGFVASSASLRHQAEFENERRWLSYDLLVGRVDAAHPLHRYLVDHGATEEELLALAEDPCPPDIVGINSYVTSERYLDDRLDLYPTSLHGGNGRERYVDVETVRVSGPVSDSFEARLREARQRYRAPLALTEVHIGCTREEQMRWLLQAWRAAQRLRDEGADVRAVTAWSAFGAVDWNSLLTVRAGHYESGIWDIRGEAPRPTALFGLARQLAHGEEPSHPVLAGSGWWQRADRLAYPAVGEISDTPVAGRPLLIVGATGMLGRAFARVCERRGLPCVLLNRADLDIARQAEVESALARLQPWAVVNAAGFERVDAAEQDPRQWTDNVVGPSVLAEVCAQHRIQLLTFSSHLVFDGRKDAPYLESDPVHPLSAYGAAKAEAERRVSEANDNALIVRTAACFCAWNVEDFVAGGLDRLRRGVAWQAVSDQRVSPTYAPELVSVSLDLLIDGERGIWHLTNVGQLSWYEFACRAAAGAGLDPSRVVGVPGKRYQRASRPRQSALASGRGQVMGKLETALSRYLSEASFDR